MVTAIFVAVSLSGWAALNALIPDRNVTTVGTPDTDQIGYEL